ncbi:MAG: type II toxin-antitoxin system RelE/ParE family toxin [Candidatus Lokiarchaeota archaeon]|nr:type II toxin-antitoxin system RelE/ParE family toxin [Candidatus Lokiarchaeota archaeon]
MRKKLDNLRSFPQLGRKVPELDDPNIRELILRNYRLIYRIFEEKIQIIRILHGSRMFNL